MLHEKLVTSDRRYYNPHVYYCSKCGEILIGRLEIVDTRIIRRVECPYARLFSEGYHDIFIERQGPVVE